MIDVLIADGLIAAHRTRLAELAALVPGVRITCEICRGTAPEPHLCGCGGTQTVEEARQYLEMEIGILYQ